MFARVAANGRYSLAIADRTETTARGVPFAKLAYPTFTSFAQLCPNGGTLAQIWTMSSFFSATKAARVRFACATVVRHLQASRMSQPRSVTIPTDGYRSVRKNMWCLWPNSSGKLVIGR